MVNDRGYWYVRAQIFNFPAAELKRIGHHPYSNGMLIAGDAGQYDSFADSGGWWRLQQAHRHHRLRDRGRHMFPRDRDLICSPSLADTVEGRLNDMPLHVHEAASAGETVLHDFARGTLMAGEQ